LTANTASSDGLRRCEHPGAGLGPAIVRSLAEAHGGLVLLFDVEGGGLKVEVTFPPVV
jgi:signal transduction histidine kinase